MNRYATREEFDLFKGEVVRYVANNDVAIKNLIGNVRDELVTEIQGVKTMLVDPEKWAETTAIRNLRQDQLETLRNGKEKAERSKRLAFATAGAIAILSPAIARVLDAIAQWILHH